MVYPMALTSWSLPVLQMAPHPSIRSPVPGTTPLIRISTDSFTVSVIDDQNHSATLASVTLTITSVDDPTIITGDFNGTLLEDGNVTGDLNATDPDGLSDGTCFLVSSDPASPHPSIRSPVPGTTPLIRIFTGLILSPYQLPTIKTTPPP